MKLWKIHHEKYCFSIFIQHTAHMCTEACKIWLLKASPSLFFVYYKGPKLLTKKTENYLMKNYAGNDVIIFPLPFLVVSKNSSASSYVLKWWLCLGGFVGSIRFCLKFRSKWQLTSISSLNSILQGIHRLCFNRFFFGKIENLLSLTSQTFPLAQLKSE